MDETRALGSSGNPGRPHRAKIIAGPDAGRSFAIDRRLMVGTSERADVALTDRTVSRRHLTLEPFARGVRVRDEDSKNGTWHGDAQLLEAVVLAGTEIKLGETVMLIDVDRFADAATPVKTYTGFGRFLGKSPVLRAMYVELERAATSEATVLIEGESGTGKELVSEAIHEHSPRANGPFVVVDCASLPEQLIESELFGHEAGAFTGATRRRLGAFEQAAGGTIFLDEIGELPLALQTRLLRVLESREIRRVGGEEPIAIDVRVIAATNRNLDREVEEGRFRLDLYHRLAVVSVRVPPLRERLDDLELLARQIAAQFGRSDVTLPADVLQRMKTYRWPGNVRELRNHVERLCILGDAGPLEPAEAPSAHTGSDSIRTAATSGLPYRQAREAVLEAFTREYVVDMLERHSGNVSKAAIAAGVARRHFHRLKAP